jgi:hypothetical protein
VTEVEVSPRAGQRLSKIDSRGWPDMPQMINLFLDWRPGENGKTEKQDPLSRRKMTFWLSIIMVT